MCRVEGVRFQRKGGVTGLLHWKSRSAASGRCGDPEGTLFLPSFRLNFEGLYQSECYGADRLGQQETAFSVSFLSVSWSLPPGSPSPEFSLLAPQTAPRARGGAESRGLMGSLQSLGDRKGRAGEGSTAPAGEVREVITKSPPGSVS